MTVMTCVAFPTSTGTGKSGAAAGADVGSPDPPPTVVPPGFVVEVVLPDGLAEADRDAEDDTDGVAGVEGDAEVEADAEGDAEAEGEAVGLAGAELAPAVRSLRSAPGATETAEPAGSFWSPQADTRVIVPMTASRHVYLWEERSTK
ncbi:hypothetical protein AB0M38_13375 [Streptomyces sp. NPDC051742]|uniref:hypothetical protein n=1 Tax=unclassified Streptomyces TaxID=2593676 RepID=UPI0034236C8F